MGNSTTPSGEQNYLKTHKNSTFLQSKKFTKKKHS